MENRETNEKKNKSKSVGYIVAAIVGAVIAAAAILVVLFATGVIGEKNDETSVTENRESTQISETTETEETTANTEEPTANVQSNAEGKYKEFTVENVQCIRTNTATSEQEWVDLEEPLTFQIPYMNEFEDADLDFDSLSADSASLQIIENDSNHSSQAIYSVVTTLTGGEGKWTEDLIIFYQDSKCCCESITSLSFSIRTPSCLIESQYYGSLDTAIYSVTEDYVNNTLNGYTCSGYTIKNGVFYDRNGKVINEEAFRNECIRVVTEAHGKQYS